MHSFSELEEALSLERFSRYLLWGGGDRARALDLYALNTRISESLYTPMQMLEVSLRNRIHAVMTHIAGETWFLDESLLLGDHQERQLAVAIADLEREGKDSNPSRIVAALTFSFWTAMLGKPYETLWQEGLHQIGRRQDGKGLRRKDFSTPLGQIRTLRNRIAHHEPILYWRLERKHNAILEVTEWLSPSAAAWCQQHSRFYEEWPQDNNNGAIITRSDYVSATMDPASDDKERQPS